MENKIQEWLDPQLEKLGLSIEQYARKCKLSKAAIYFYRSGHSTPSVQAMAAMCAVLGVPLEEGLAQYTPKPIGRPRRS